MGDKSPEKVCSHVTSRRLAGDFLPKQERRQEHHAHNQGKNRSDYRASLKSMLEPKRNAECERQAKSHLTGKRRNDGKDCPNQQVCIRSPLQVPNKKQGRQNRQRRERDIGHERVGKGKIDWIEYQCKRANDCQ